MIRLTLNRQRIACSKHAAQTFAVSRMPKRYTSEAGVEYIIGTIEEIEQRFGARVPLASGADGLLYRLGDKQYLLKIYYDDLALDREYQIMHAIADEMTTSEYVSRVYSVYKIDNLASTPVDFFDELSRWVYLTIGAPPIEQVEFTGVYAMVYEYFDGVPLDEYANTFLKNTPSVEQIRSIVNIVTGAFKALDEVGIVHRDIHEGNVLISRDGRVARIIDYAQTCIIPDTILSRHLDGKYDCEHDLDEYSLEIDWIATPKHIKELHQGSIRDKSVFFHTLRAEQVFDVGYQLTRMIASERLIKVFGGRSRYAARDVSNDVLDELVNERLYKADAEIDKALRTMLGMVVLNVDPEFPSELPLMPSTTSTGVSLSSSVESLRRTSRAQRRFYATYNTGNLELRTLRM